MISIRNKRILILIGDISIGLILYENYTCKIRVETKSTYNQNYFGLTHFVTWKGPSRQCFIFNFSVFFQTTHSSPLIFLLRHPVIRLPNFNFFYFSSKLIMNLPIHIRTIIVSIPST